MSKSKKTSKPAGTMTPAVRRLLATAAGRDQLRRALDAAEPPARNASAALVRCGAPAVTALRTDRLTQQIAVGLGIIAASEIVDASPEVTGQWLTAAGIGDPHDAR